MASTKRRLSDGEAGESSSSRLKLDVPLELAPNDDLDKSVIDHFEDEPFDPTSLLNATTLLNVIVSKSGGRLDPDYKDLPNAKALLRDNPWLMKLLGKAWNYKQFEDIRNLKILQHPRMVVPAPRALPREQEKATEDSWEREFVGNAADALWEYIMKSFNPQNEKVYAHYTSIVQSSGMGKSRTIDELGKCHFVIPINLRSAISTGFPPADHAVRDFLSKADTQAEAYKRACTFLEALFDNTAAVVQGKCGDATSLSDLAQTFRELLTKGQKMQKHNSFREAFYSDVVRYAELKLAVSKNEDPHSTEKNIVYATPSKSKSATTYNFPPAASFARLVGALQVESESNDDSTPTPSPTKSKGKSRKKTKPKRNSAPVVVLACDEAHTLTDIIQEEEDVEWSKFSEFRHALRALNRFPLFSVFLSTTGKIQQFTSKEDISRRIMEVELNLIQPFTDVGFDTLAKAVSLDGTWDLESVTADAHIVHLGRPLFGSRYDAGDLSVREDIIKFAAGKLLNADPSIPELDIHQQLACLSQRLPIEFNSTMYTAQKSERKQVEGHLRVCLKIDQSFESMVTVSASEPLLSEGAYFIMQRPSFNAPKVMKLVLEGFSIHKGDRGEFLGLLLLTLARNDAVGPADQNGRPLEHRYFDVASYIYGSLFMQPPGLDTDLASALEQLQEEFPSAKAHFSHFVKLHEHKAVDKESLLYLASRGAAVLCGNNHFGIDGAIPFLYHSILLHQEIGKSMIREYNI